MRRGLIVGLTGGIACGKTTVAGMFRRLGAHVIDADSIGHELLKKGSPVYARLVEEFGEGVLDEEGNVSREKLGRIVFSDPERRRRLNEIVHPVIVEKALRLARELAEADPEGVVVIEAPLLFEVGMDGEVDVTVAVVADEELQVERQLERWRRMGRKADRREAISRIRAQMPASEKAKRADFVIENNGTVRELWERVLEVWDELRNIKR